ncbi:hypothetical protein COY06_01345, partial [Candidatus Peregrinibacteria bacterium CG_4_10_14_0_2_um_filter_41_8]
GVGLDNGTRLNAIVNSVRLEDADGNVLAAAASVQTNGTVVFTNVDLPIAAGVTEIVYVVGDISSDAFKDSEGENVAFGISSTANVTVEDADGNSFTPSGTPNSEGTTTTDPSVFMTVADGGSLTIAVDTANTAKEDIVIGGATGVDTSTFKFTSTEEAFVVKNISINNRQSAATALGDYDNNVVSVGLSYENEAGETQTKTGFLTNGTAQFSGLDLYVPKNGDALLTVSVNAQTIPAGATVAEFIDLNLAFNNFEATAQSSGETYKGSKLDADVSATSDLDFGTMTFVDSGANHAALADAVAAGSSATLTVPDFGTENLPIGTLVKFGANSATYVETTDILVVLTTAYTAGDLTLTGFVLNDDDGDANGDDIYYALPGTGYLTAANQMHVYKTKPTVTLASNSPSGTKTASATDTIMNLSMSADSHEDVVLRQGLAGDDENAGFGMDVNGTDDFTITTTAGDYIDGSGGFLWTTTADSITDNDCFVPDESYTAGTFGANKYMSFWIKSNQSDTPYNDFSVIVDETTPANGSCVPAVAGDELRLTTANSVWVNGVAMSSDTQIIGGGTADTWDLVTVDISGTTNIATAIAGGFIVDATGGLTVANTDLLYIDGIVFHNEMLTVDLAGNGQFNLNPTDAVDCSLKDGTTTLAIGSAGVRTASKARVLFAPTDEISGTDYTEFLIGSTAKNY